MKSSLNINQDVKLNMTLNHSIKIWNVHRKIRIKNFLHFKKKEKKEKFERILLRISFTFWHKSLASF